eukprot:586477-Pleurochrysis_carterae.AAC.1
MSAGTGVSFAKYPLKPGVRTGEGRSTSRRLDEGKPSTRSRLSRRVIHRASQRMTSPYEFG